MCAPKCKVKNPRPKRVNRYSQLNDERQHLNASKNNNSHKNNNRNGKRQQHQPNYQSSNQRINAMKSDRTQFQSDKIISIIAPSSLSSSIRPSNLTSSHSNKKFIDAHAVATVVVATQAPSNVNRNAMKSTQQSTTKRHLLATVHSLHGSKQRATKNHNVGNSSSSNSRIDNNIVGVNSRHQIPSVEQEFASKFHGHDIPYPPIDLAVSFNDYFKEDCDRL